MSAAGLKDLTPLDVLVLHHVTHRARDKRLADICFIMNVEDTHLINYSLKKLLNLGVVVGSKNGKEVTYASTELGRGACAALSGDPRGLPDQRAQGRRRPEPRHRRTGAAVARVVRHVRPGRAGSGVVVTRFLIQIGIIPASFGHCELLIYD
jgi:hypothetical protein